jgi:hypothetical protein
VDINCCFQIRYKGAKGVLLLNEELSPNTIALRKSMVKYGCEDAAAKKYLDIVSWDKYLPGYLNRQIIILLKSLKITDEAFLKFQRRYIKQLTSLTFQEIDGNLLRIFNDADDSEGSFILTISYLKDHLDLSRDIFFDRLLECIKDTKFKELKKKSRILIEKSARLIGVLFLRFRLLTIMMYLEMANYIAALEDQSNQAFKSYQAMLSSQEILP